MGHWLEAFEQLLQNEAPDVDSKYTCGGGGGGEGVMWGRKGEGTWRVEGLEGRDMGGESREACCHHKVFELLSNVTVFQ